MKKTDRSVVRNVSYTRNKVNNMERHNERKNKSYNNENVRLECSALNVHYKDCQEEYLQCFDRMVSEGVISLRGLKKDAKVIDEMIFDVNSEYFERHGGYEYAKQFFQEAYQMAVKEIGGDQYILSAVMHADEKNLKLSEKYGHDVFHYHLHVVYVPVVDMEVKWTKRCKNPELIGTTKEIVKQVSNSKKWKSQKVADKNGKERLVYSYSLLQDRYYEHMREAGYRDFERGERGSTTEHLDDLEYKVQQEKQAAVALEKSMEKKKSAVSILDEVIGNKKQAVSMLDKKIEKNKQTLSELKEKNMIARQGAMPFSKIEKIAEKRTVLGDIAVTPADWKLVSDLAKEGVQSRNVIRKLKDQIKGLLLEIANLKKSLQRYEGQSITDTMRYYQAKQRAPERMKAVIEEIMQRPPEQKHISEKIKEKSNLERM